MKHLIFVFSILILSSCGSKSPAELELEKIQSDAQVHKDDLPKVDSLEFEPSKLDFSNPSVFMGSDFGNFFNTLYKQGKFEDMLAFTSSQSINQFGKDVILNFYKNDLKFGYEIGKPHSQTVVGDIITLNYDANIIATKRVVRFNIVVENDSCKIVLPNDLNDFPG